MRKAWMLHKIMTLASPLLSRDNVNALYEEILWVLTHRWSCQRLSSNQLGRAKTIQEVTELGI